jgi:CRP-like cAMP-binding protein
MSTEKNHNQEIKVETNILKFPKGKKNEQLEQHRKLNEQLINSIARKMSNEKYDQLPLIQEEILLLSNHGETIEFPPNIAARLISVLANQLNRNSFMEDLL